MMKRLFGLGLLVVLTLCETGIVPQGGIVPQDIRLKTTEQKISASAVPPNVKKVFNADLHMEGNILVGNDVADSCNSGYQYSHLRGWYHAASSVSEADQANGIRTLDLYYYKASLFRSWPIVVWTSIAAGDGPGNVEVVAEERIATGAMVAVPLERCS